MSKQIEVKATVKPITEYLVRINYKSGISQDCWFRKLDTKHNGTAITSMEWTTAEGEAPLFIGIDSIESIFQLDTRTV